MADFKGFGAMRPELSPITLTEVNESEMDRAMRFFLRNGCKRKNTSPSRANTGLRCQIWKPEAQWLHEIQWAYH